MALVWLYDSRKKQHGFMKKFESSCGNYDCNFILLLAFYLTSRPVCDLILQFPNLAHLLTVLFL